MTEEDFKNGQVLLIDKPLKWTSFQVVNKIRWEIKQRFNLKKIKVGHAGTLDPLASGLLIICTGKFTKKINEFQAQQKEYTGTFTLGGTTPSYDLETEINNTFSTKHINTKLVQEAVQHFIGEIEQKPPIFSAIKKDGKRLYEHARAGEIVQIKSRKVSIHSFKILNFVAPNINVEISCSKGTYIRSIAHDFGIALKSGAHLSQLRRTKIGDYNVKNAETIEEFIARLNLLQ